MAKQQTWWEGNSTRLWRTLVLMYLGLITALGTYGMVKVVEIPEKYPTKPELQCMIDRLERTMSAGFQVQERRATIQEQKIDNINNYLRSN